MEVAPVLEHVAAEELGLGAEGDVALEGGLEAVVVDIGFDPEAEEGALVEAILEYPKRFQREKRFKIATSMSRTTD